jgi:hypothetical protein
MTLTKAEREDLIIEETIKKFLEDAALENNRVIREAVIAQVTCTLVGKLASVDEQCRVLNLVKNKIQEGIANGKYLLGKGPNSFGLILAK